MGLKDIFMKIFRRNQKLLNSGKSVEEEQSNSSTASKREEYEKQIKQHISINQEKMIEEITLIGLLKNPALNQKILEELRNLGYEDLNENEKIIEAIEEKGKVLWDRDEISGVAIPGKYATEKVAEGEKTIENVSIYSCKNSLYYIDHKTRISSPKGSLIIDDKSTFDVDGIELRKEYNEKTIKDNSEQKELNEAGYVIERSGIDKVKYKQGEESVYIDLNQYSEKDRDYDLSQLPNLKESFENGKIDKDIVYKQYNPESMWERVRIGGILNLMGKSKYSEGLKKYMDNQKEI